MHTKDEAARRDRTCPAEAAVRVIGGRWKVPIIYHLFGGTLRFGELKRRLGGVTQKMLTKQLRELEADRVVSRKVYREVPPRVEYSLAEAGKSLKPAVDAMCRWGVARAGKSRKPRSRAPGVDEPPGTSYGAGLSRRQDPI